MEIQNIEGGGHESKWKQFLHVFILQDEVEVFEEIVEPTPSVTPSIEGDMSESTASLPGDSQDMQAAPTGNLLIFSFNLYLFFCLF